MPIHTAEKPVTGASRSRSVRLGVTIGAAVFVLACLLTAGCCWLAPFPLVFGSYAVAGPHAMRPSRSAFMRIAGTPSRWPLMRSRGVHYWTFGGTTYRASFLWSAGSVEVWRVIRVR